MPTGSKLLSLKSSLDFPESSKAHHLVSLQVSILPEELALGIGQLRDVLFLIMYMDPEVGISQGIPDRASGGVVNPGILTQVTPGTLGTRTLRGAWIIWLRTGAWEFARSGSSPTLQL